MSNKAVGDLNPVLLHAQNIDLRQRLEAAEARIADLQVIATQNTVHVINESRQLNASLEALRAGAASGGAGGRSPDRQLLDQLRERCGRAEEQASASLKLVESLRAENEKLNAMRRDQSDSFPTTPTAPPASSPPAHAVSAVGNPLSGGDEQKAALEKQVNALRAQLATSNAEVMRWKAASTNSTNESNKLRAELNQLQASSSRNSANNNNVASTQAHVDKIKAINEELNDQLQLRGAELESSQAEIEALKQSVEKAKADLAQTQQMLVRSTQKVGQSTNESSKDKNKIAALEAEVAKLQEMAADEKADNDALRAQIAAMETEHESAKRAAAEREFDKLLEGTDEESRLRKLVRDMEDAMTKMDADLEKSQSERMIMMKLKDKTLLQLNQTSEELIKAREHFQKREQELMAQIAALQNGQQQQQQQQAAVAATSAAEEQKKQQQQLAQATAQQQKLQDDRDSTARDRRKAELMAKLQAKTREDKSSAQVIFSSTATAYDKLLKKLRAAHADDAGTGQEEVYYDFLWDYERQLFHLKNDLASMTTIVGIKTQDLEAENRQLKESMESRLTILRFQLQDLGATPQC